MKRPCGDAPPALLSEVRARITPLFPGWDPDAIEELVCQMAALQWRYLAASDEETGRVPTNFHDYGASGEPEGSGNE